MKKQAKGDKMGRTINPTRFVGKLYKLTDFSPRFSQEVADAINKDYPNEAFIKDGCCFVSKLYQRKCYRYVLNNCKIKKMETAKWK